MCSIKFFFLSSLKSESIEEHLTVFTQDCIDFYDVKFVFVFVNCSGQTYTQFAKVANCLNIQMMSEVLFYRYHRAYIVPAVDNMYQITIAAARNFVANQGGLSV